MTLLSINEMTTYRWSFEEDVTQYQAAGIESIGVWRQKLSDFGEEKGVELLADAGLKASCLLWAGGFTGSEGRSHQESLDDATEAIRMASAMNAGCLILYSGARGGHTRSHARRLIRSALENLAPLASQLDVTLAVEPMHVGCAAEWTFLTDLDETLALLDAVESPWVKLVFDTYHLGQDTTILDRLPDMVSQIALVQLGDSKAPPNGEQDRCRLGEGTLPLTEIVATLTGAGYGGFYDIELVGEEFEAADYRELLEHSKQAFASLVGAAGL